MKQRIKTARTGPYITRDISRETEIDVRDFGAKPGDSDSKAKILRAINVANGRPVTGGNLDYGVAGNLAFHESVYLKNIGITQLTPNIGNIKTLRSTNIDNITLENVKLNRNGDGLSGFLNSDAGIWIEGGSNHFFNNVEVFGNNVGTGFTVQGASDFTCFRVIAHDIRYLGPDPGDDITQGIWFNNCSGFTYVNCDTYNLGGWDGGPPTQYSRGFALGGNTDFTAHNPRAWDVDQGHDITGSAGNTRFEITGGLMRDCYTAGFKFASSARDGTISGAVAERCGLFGFGVSGPSEAGLTILSSNIDVIGCSAYDTGSNGVWGALLTVAGFKVQNGDFDLNSTTGIRYIACKAIDRQTIPTMEYGFWQDITPNTANETIDCYVIGATVADFQGF